MTNHVAWHEAGHLFMALFLGARVLSSSCEECAGHGQSAVLWDGDLPRHEQLRRSAMVALAGPIAETRSHQSTTEATELLPAWSQDLIEVMAFAKHQARGNAGQNSQALLQQWIAEVDQVLDIHWDGLARIFDELDAHEELDEDAIAVLAQSLVFFDY